MRRIVLALAAVAAFGLAVPTLGMSPAEARDVVIIKKKKHRDHGRHLGWQRGKHYGWSKHHRRHHRPPHGVRVIVR
jgi:hypothetical protein